MLTVTTELTRAIRAVRPGRLTIVVATSLAAGLAGDWFRAEQRLVFPRPLPVFKTTAPTR
ncbi:MAG: hypothetical protein EXS37_20660 [Opitutus sp.]|nr:hypothetical protein [Opitutus sp.]